MIPGLETFKGQKVHSAQWDSNFDYSNKRIAVIGNGSSGIQIIPQMAKLPGTEVFSFQRSPTYIYYRMPPSKLLNRTDISSNPEYSEEDKKRFREEPGAHKAHRKMLIHRINKAFRTVTFSRLLFPASSHFQLLLKCTVLTHVVPQFIKDSPQLAEATKNAREQMAEKLNHDPRLCKMLIPEWSLGCRRITPGEGYLESFLRDNVHLTQSRITNITENAVVTEDGKEHEVDVGKFCTSIFPPVPPIPQH